MTTESPELAAVAQRWLKAQQEKNPDILVGLFSDSEHLRYLGTGPDEAWAGQYIRDGFPRHTKEIPHFEAHTEQIEAFENGDTGWATWIGTLKFDEIEEPKALRISWIFVLERGNWKIISQHSSTPRSNFEIAGHEHFAFAELIQQAKEILPSLGHEGTATIMFTDIVGSASHNQKVGDKVWTSAISNHFADVEAIVTGNGGELVKSLGDGTMTSFETVAGALRSSLQLHEKIKRSNKDPKFQIRIGIHTGEVIKTGDDFFGSVVNTAARVAEAATAEQTLVSDAVRQLAPPGEFQFSEPMVLKIRGIEGTSTICAVR